ncbi:TrkH-domain-containing protein [Fomes fomentarius]|nr:TrkH-domain-containing protein [Fomes fomentarius]
MPSLWTSISSSLNFYRIHFLVFSTISLLGAAIFWADNGQSPVKFVDALYVCVSSTTGTGLATIDLSSLTTWQQIVIVILELIGNQTCVAWFIVCFRRWYFIRNLGHIVAAELSRSHTSPMTHQISYLTGHTPDTRAHFNANDEVEASDWSLTRRTKPGGQQRNAKSAPIRPDMVRRLDVAPHRINPMGSHAPTIPLIVIEESGLDTLGHAASHRSLHSSMAPSHPPPTEEDDLGEFPGLQSIINCALKKVYPRYQRRLARTLTVPRIETLVPCEATMLVPPAGSVKLVPYLSFTATVRHSTFLDLTQENIEELGGVEYRALTALMWIIPLYYVGSLVISFVVTAPYMAMPRWQENFRPPLQHRKINTVWFTAFQIVGAWENTGMSLVDQNMVPFQTAYPLVFFLVFCVLGGNTCLPIFLRISIWFLTKLPGRSRMKESLHFLLDHPRRCTVHLFPSRQTWLLFATVMLLNLTILILDLLLNKDNPVTKSISFGVRFVDAVLIAVACRDAGYQPIPVSSLVPAVQVLFVIMMYIAIYPIAMSVRSTNVYEEHSLGVYDQEDEYDPIDNDAHWNRPSESRVAIWGKYLTRHARKQLSFDMWWLSVSLFVLCVTERKNLTDPEKMPYFNVFALLFELVSAYGTVGLSLGIPGLNYSLSGDMRTISKLVIILAMLRGRHRGLPVALDRAVLMPREFLSTSSPGQVQPQTEKEGVINEKEARDDHDAELGDIAPPLSECDRDERKVCVRMRTRTISSIVEEMRDPVLVDGTDMDT